MAATKVTTTSEAGYIGATASSEVTIVKRASASTRYVELPAFNFPSQADMTEKTYTSHTPPRNPRIHKP